MAATLKEIAAQVGVSYETVSRALNNRGRVSEVTAKRIREVANALGYTPNVLARSLRVRNTKTIGVIFPCIYENEFYAGIYRGLEDAMVERGYVLFLCNSNFDPRREATFLDSLRGRQVDGILLALAEPEVETCSNIDQLHAIQQSGQTPLVMVDRYLHGFDCDYVGSDHFLGARLAVEHLVGLGHRRIGCIANERATSVEERLEGYRFVLRQAGITLHDEWVSRPEERYEAGGVTALRELLDLPEELRPTAIFSVTDLAAIGAVQAAHERGLSLPDDLSLIGFDDLRLSANLPVPLSTVRQDLREIGRQAAELMLSRIEDESGTPADVRRIRVPTQLVLRKTTAPPR